VASSSSVPPASCPLNRHGDLLRARVRVVRGEHRRRWDGHVHQGRGEARRCARPPGEVDPVEVGEHTRDPVGLLAVGRQVVDDLAERVGVGDRQCPWEVAEERHPGADGGDVGYQCGRGQRRRAALAAADHRDPRRVDGRQRPGGIDRTGSVGEQPPVVVRLARGYAPGHHPRHLRPPAAGVGGVAATPAGALAPGVHLQVRKAGTGPEQVVDRVPAPAAVPDELHDRGQRPAGPQGRCRQPQPRPDRLPGPPGERDVEDFERLQAGGDRLGPDLAAGRPGLGQRRAPELVEVGRVALAAAIGAQLRLGQIGVQGVSSSRGPARGSACVPAPDERGPTVLAGGPAPDRIGADLLDDELTAELYEHGPIVAVRVAGSPAALPAYPAAGLAAQLSFVAEIPPST